MIILIAGASRSGKTILAKKLNQQLGISYLPVDSIISSLESFFPEIGIQHRDDNEAYSPKLASYLKELTNHIGYEDLDLVLDTYQLFPKDFNAVFPERLVQAVYLGYPDLSVEEKLQDIRMFQRNKDWTAAMDDQTLRPIISQFICESKKMADQCREQGLPFFDTGTSFQKGIEDAFICLEEKLVNFRGLSP